MATTQELFEREVRFALRSLPKVRDLRNLPLPEEAKGWPRVGAVEYLVDGVRDSVFSGLNGVTVRELPGKARARVMEEWGEYRVDSRGEEVWESVSVPSGSLAVVSNKSLKVPWGYESSEDGLGYLDFVTDKMGTRWYMYIVPKGCLYRCNKCALVVSTKNNLRMYGGMSFNTWGFGKITVAVIKYVPGRVYDNTIILSVKRSLSFNEEYEILTRYWEKVGVLSDPADFETEMGSNLIMSEVVPNEDEFVPVEEEPLGDFVMAEMDLSEVKLDVPE